MINKRRELITIIIPIYNVDKYLKKTMESIINQSYKNIEILLINDGSTDNSGKICDIYAKKDNRIKVFHQENKGVSSARNLGINNAKGEYIVFVDGDDYVSSKYISSLYECITKNEADMAVQMYVNYYSDNRMIRNIKEDINANISGVEFIDFEILEGRDTTVYVKIYLKSIIDKFKIRFNENISNLEDMLFLFYYSSHCNKVNYTSTVNYYRIIRKDGVAFSGFNEKKLTALKVFDIIDKELKEYKNNLFIIKNMINKFNTILYFYAEIIFENVDDKELKKSLLSDIKHMYKRYSSYVKLNSKIKFFILIYIPNLYKMLRKIKDKLNK